MTATTWLLTDADSNLHQAEITIQPSQTLSLPGSDRWRIRQLTLRGGTSEGVSVVELNNGQLSVSLLPTRGMGIWNGVCQGVPLEWKSPVPRPVHPAFVNLNDRHGLGWLHGFNELLCRCGLAFNGPPGDDHGAEITLHGRIANLPANRVEAAVNPGTNTLEVRGIVEETTMFGPCFRLSTTYRTVAGSNSVTIIDEVTNLGASPAELSLLYHINIGRPFLEAGGSFAVPFREMAPRDPRAAEGIAEYQQYAAPDANYAEQAYFFAPAANAEGWSLALLKNATGDRGFAVRFHTKHLPWFTLWKNTQAEANGYVTGLEPGVNLPNFRAFERTHKRLPQLASGETYRTEMSLEIATDAGQVSALDAEIARIQKQLHPLIHRVPQPGWSAAGTP